MPILTGPLPRPGHGRPGAASGRTFDDLQELSNYDSRAVLEILPATVIDPGMWTSDFSGGWFQSWSPDKFGIQLDVVAVRAFNEFLTRVPTVPICQATPGTYYYRVKDSSPVLWVNPNGGDPSSTITRITTKFLYSSGAETADQLVQPQFGPQLVSNGDYENGVTGWTEVKSGAGWTTGRSLTNPIEGLSMGQIVSTGAASGFGSRYQVIGTVGPNAAWETRMYRSAILYRTPYGQPSTATAYLRVGTTTSLKDDGRTAATTLANGVELPATGGRIRLYFFDFYAHEDNVRLWIRLVNSAATACSLDWDVVEAWEITGWYYAEPRLPEDGLPETTQGSASPMPGEKRIGGGSVKLLAGGGPLVAQPLGYLEQVFAPQPWVYDQKELRSLVGGSFPGGEDIPYHAMYPGYAGIIAGNRVLTLAQGALTLSTLDPQRSLAVSPLRRTYDDTFTDVESRDRGAFRPIVLGPMPGYMRPAGIERITSTSYRRYEVCDTTGWSPGILSVDSVRAFPDSQAADDENPIAFVDLVSGKDFTANLTAGTIDIIADVQMFEVTAERNIINITTTAGTHRIVVPLGWKRLGYGGSTVADRRGLLNEIRALIAAASGKANFSVTYSETTHLISFAAGDGTNVTVLSSTGADKNVSILPFFGFLTAADVGPVVTATSTTPMFLPTVAGVPSSDAENKHHIRVRISGLKDDAAGTYTGAAGALIQKASDQFRFAHEALLLKPPSRINVASFVQARSDSPQVNSRVFSGRPSQSSAAGVVRPGQAVAGGLTLQGWANELEMGTLSDILLDGQGAFHYRKRSNAVTGREPHIYNRDCLDVLSHVPGDQTSATVIMTYAHDPRGRFKSSQVYSNLTAVLFDNDGVFTGQTCLVDETDADAARDFIAALRRAGIRHIELRVAGKLLKAMVGDLAYLTLEQVLLGTTVGQAITEELFRLESITKNWVTHVCVAHFHTNILS